MPFYLWMKSFREPDAMIDPALLDPFAEHRLMLTRRRFFGLTAQSLGAGLGALAAAEYRRRDRLQIVPRLPVIHKTHHSNTSPGQRQAQIQGAP